MRILQFILQFLATRGWKRTPSVRTVHVNLPKDGPGGEYVRRLDEREAQLERCRALHRHFWIYLVASATAATAIGLLALSSRLDVGWIFPPLAVVAFSLQTLTRNAKLHSRLGRIVGLYRSGIERLTDQWQGRGVRGQEYLAAGHLYAADLDVFGDGSLFELLCTARTGIGRRMLAKWLLQPADPDEIVRRQHAVAELRDRLDLREEWASLGEVSVENVELSYLSEWASAPASKAAPTLRILAIVLPIFLLEVGVLFAFGVVTSHCPLVLGLPLVLEALVAGVLWRKTRAVTDNVVLPSFELGTIAPLLRCLEEQEFQCPLLRSLRSRLVEGRCVRRRG